MKKGPTMIDIKKILHPTDFSDNADAALPYVKEFAKKFGAKVSLVHVVAVPVYAASYEISVDLTSMRDALFDGAKKKLAELEAQLKAEGIAVESFVEIGTSYVEIITTAEREKVDMIVLATHGLGGLKHMLLGSTAERVVRKAPCPVLTIHHPEHEFVK